MNTFRIQRWTLFAGAIMAIAVAQSLVGCAPHDDSTVANNNSTGPAAAPVSQQDMIDKIRNNPNIPQSVKDRLIKQIQDKDALKDPVKK